MVITSDRETLHANLMRRNPKMARIYIGGIRALADEDNPCKYELAAHSVRELMRSCPALAGFEPGVQAVMQYARWIKTSDGRAIADPSGLAKALELLANRLDPTTDTSVAVREMFGMHFNLLAWLDRKWLEQNLSALFPKKPSVLDRFAWNSYLRFSRPLADTLPAMRFRYQRAINALQPGAWYGS
jgi:hypothetical protein